MPESNVFTPKQSRSLDTQRKLLEALHHCLKSKFFEHITIKELAEYAGVSVGTFYRRFKDKESLLPLLYRDFGIDLNNWVNALEANQFDDLQQAVRTMCEQTYEFLLSRKSVFRTLHLNSRLHTGLIDSDQQIDRKVIYQRMSNILLRHKNEMSVADPQQAADTLVFIIINTLLEKVLYADLTPAIASELDAQAFAQHLPDMFLAFLLGRVDLC